MRSREYRTETHMSALQSPRGSLVENTRSAEQCAPEFATTDAEPHETRDRDVREQESLVAEVGIRRT